MQTTAFCPGNALVEFAGAFRDQAFGLLVPLFGSLENDIQVAIIRDDRDNGALKHEPKVTRPTADSKNSCFIGAFAKGETPTGSPSTNGVKCTLQATFRIGQNN